MKTRHYIAVFVILAALILLRFVVEIGDREPGFYMVTRIIDGDTVELDGHETLRLSGIDTPEEGEILADSAEAYLAGVILRHKVRVETGFRKRDRYGRLLGFVYLDTVLVNAEILKHGLGRMYLFPDNRYDQFVLDKLYAAQRLAMAEEVGVWALPLIMEEEYYIGNSRSMRFHRPGCRSVELMSDNNKVIFSDPERAYYEGYAPCRNCKP